MNWLFKNTFNLITAIFCMLVLFNCTQNNFYESGSEKEISYEDKVLDLSKRLKQLPKYCDPAEFMPIYKELVPLLNHYSDTSNRTAGVRNTVIQKLLDMGVYGQAIKQCYRALEANNIQITNDSVYHNLMIYGKLVSLYEKTEAYDSISFICERAITDAKKHSESFWLSSALNNAGYYALKLGLDRPALEFLTKADSILDIHGQNNRYGFMFQGSVKHNLASVYEKQNNLLKAREIYAFNFYERYLLERGTTSSYRNRINNGICLANLEIRLNNYSRAKEALDNVGLLMDSLDHPDKIRYEIDFQRAKVNYCEATESSKRGFDESKRLIFLKDSLTSWENTLNERAMNLLANFSSGQMEIALDQEKEARQLYEQRSKLRLWVIFMIFIIALAVTLLLIRLQKQRDKLFKADQLLSEEKLKREEEKQQTLKLKLEKKKRDLTDMALSLQLKEQWARELNTHIQKIEAERGYKRSREFKKLREEIRSNVYVDRNMDIIHQNIDVLNHDFFDTLNSRFPNLSRGESKLCGYIKLNLNTSQIAHLQNVAPSSVKVSRHRLKKKLMLEHEENLDHFIQNIC